MVNGWVLPVIWDSTLGCSVIPGRHSFFYIYIYIYLQNLLIEFSGILTITMDVNGYSSYMDGLLMVKSDGFKMVNKD